MVPQSNKNEKCENISIDDTEADDSLLLELDLNDSTSKRTLSNETSENDQIKKLKLDDSNVIYNYIESNRNDKFEIISLKEIKINSLK